MSEKVGKERLVYEGLEGMLDSQKTKFLISFFEVFSQIVVIKYFLLYCKPCYFRCIFRNFEM